MKREDEGMNRGYVSTTVTNVGCGGRWGVTQTITIPIGMFKTQTEAEEIASKIRNGR